MTKYKLKKSKVEDAIVGTYKKVENGVVAGYQSLEDAVVSTYKKIENKFSDKFLEQSPQENHK